MLDFQQMVYDQLKMFEGRVSWLYLDTHKPPLVTTSMGCAISLQESLTLPWTRAGRPATPDEIRGDFLRVSGMLGGMIASEYRLPGVSLELDDVGMDALVQKRFDLFTVQLRTLFEDFDTWPASCKAGTLDMIYGLGIGHDGTHANGLMGYPKFRAAAARHDWKTCVAECEMDADVKAYEMRNNWLKQQFLAAVGQ